MRNTRVVRSAIYRGARVTTCEKYCSNCCSVSILEGSMYHAATVSENPSGMDLEILKLFKKQNAAHSIAWELPCYKFHCLGQQGGFSSSNKAKTSLENIT